jgi:hypothetical protein
MTFFNLIRNHMPYLLDDQLHPSAGTEDTFAENRRTQGQRHLEVQWYDRKRANDNIKSLSFKNMFIWNSRTSWEDT